MAPKSKQISRRDALVSAGIAGLALLALAIHQQFRPHELLLDTLYSQMVAQKKNGNYKESTRAGQEYLKLLKSSGESNTPVLAARIYDLGEIYEEWGHNQEAENLYRQSIEITKAQRRPDYVLLARFLNDLAFVCAKQDKREEAERLYREGIQIATGTAGDHTQNLIALYANLAFLYRRENKDSLAVPLVLKTLELDKSAKLADPTNCALAEIWLGDFYQKDKNLSLAELHYKNALLQYEDKQAAPGPGDRAVPLSRLGGLKLDQKQFKESEKYFNQSIAIRSRELGPSHSSVSDDYHLLADCYADQNKLDQAQSAYEKARAIAEQMYGKQSSAYLNDLTGLAAIYGRKKDLKKAEILMKEALQLSSNLPPSESDTRIMVLDMYAKLLEILKRQKEADEVWMQAAKLSKQPH